MTTEAWFDGLTAELLAQSPEQVATYRAGKASALGWFVGQVMRRLGGKANPQMVGALLRRALEGREPGGGDGR